MWLHFFQIITREFSDALRLTFAGGKEIFYHMETNVYRFKRKVT